MSTRLDAPGSDNTQFARGWYLVHWSTDLEPGDVVPVRYFGRDFVLFRGDDGKAVMLDAHCPHLGASLAHGGRVQGCEIVCPFHAWRFDSTGQCTDIPYASRIPKKAKTRSIALTEHSGMILAHFAWGDERAPTYEVPHIDELDDPAWTKLTCAQITIPTQPREVVENVADLAHFRPVHKMLIDDFKVTIDGPRATQWTLGRGRNLKGEAIPVESTATYHGPAVQFTRLGWAYDMMLINAHVPIDDTSLVLRFGVTLRAGVGVELPQQVIDMHVAAARDGYFQDVAIWKHKRWRERPVLADGDGPIAQIRQWHRGFYGQAEQTATTPAR